MNSFTLYRFFDDADELLYVGKTINPPRRLKEHASEKTWWSTVANIDIEQFPDQESLDYAEKVAITREAPRYNIALAERPKGVSNAEKRRTLEAFGWVCISNAGSGSFYRPERRSAVYTRAAAWTQWLR